MVNGTPVTSGTASAAINLNIGANVITTVVTAQDGKTTDTYTLTIYRGSTNDALSNVTLSNGTLSPAFHYTTLEFPYRQCGQLNRLYNRNPNSGRCHSNHRGEWHNRSIEDSFRLQSLWLLAKTTSLLL